MSGVGGLTGTAVPLVSKGSLVSSKPLTVRPVREVVKSSVGKVPSSPAKKQSGPRSTVVAQKNPPAKAVIASPISPPKTCLSRALELLQQERNPAQSGEVVCRWNHYRKAFPCYNGVVKFTDIDEQYSFSFVYKGSFTRKLRLDSGTSEDDDDPNVFLLTDEAMDYFLDVDPKLSYRIVIIEDPVAGVGAEGLRIRDGPLRSQALGSSSSTSTTNKSRQVAIITDELLKMNVADLHSAEAIALREARDVEDLLFSNACK